MIAPIEIIKTKIKGGAGMPTPDYAQLLYKGEEIGFVTDEGIFLKMKDPVIKSGVFQNLGILLEKSFSQKCKYIEKNWEAMYDRYITVVRGK